MADVFGAAVADVGGAAVADMGGAAVADVGGAAVADAGGAAVADAALDGLRSLMSSVTSFHFFYSICSFFFFSLLSCLSFRCRSTASHSINSLVRFVSSMKTSAFVWS